MSEFLLNPARLSFQAPGVLAGLLLAGNRGEGRFAGNGDCILVDGSLGLLALADGAERSPRASRAFLQGLAERLLAAAGSDDSADRQERLVNATQAVLESFPYEDRTTFLCLTPLQDGSVYYVGGGDSLLFHLDPAAERILYHNRSNMGFAGRSQRILDSGRLEAKPGDLLLLASDGLWDLLRGRRRDLIRFVFETLKQGPVQALPETLVRGRHPAYREGADRTYDDLSLLVVSPGRFAGVRSRVILGGTGNRMEAHYRQLCQRNALPDRYVCLPPGHSPLWVFPDQLELL